MKDLEINIRDWADKENVVVEHIIETSYNIKIYTNCVHFQDLCKLNNMVEDYHVAFIEKDLSGNMRINISKDA